MKRNLFTKVLSLGIGLSMLLSSAVMATDLKPGDVEVEIPSGSQNPKYGLVVPPTFKLAINPFEYQDAGSQITTPDYVFFNKAEIPITLSVKAEITGVKDGVNVELVDTNVVEDDDVKRIFMELVPAKGDPENPTTAANQGVKLDAADTKKEKVDGKVTFDTTAANKAVVGFTPTTGKVAAKLEFYLDKATYTTGAYTATAGTHGAGAFRISGKVNSKALYDDGDVNVKLVYGFNGLKQSEYNIAWKLDPITGAADGSGTLAMKTGALNLFDAVAGDETTSITIVDTEPTLVLAGGGTAIAKGQPWVFTYTDGAGKHKLADPTAITSIQASKNGATPITVAASASGYSAAHDTKTITISSTWTGGSSVVSGAKYIITINWADGSASSAELTVS